MRYSEQETVETIKRVVSDLCGAVETTLGPFGSNVLLGDANMTPKSTKDGVSVGKHWFSIHPDERVVSNLIKQACIQTYEDAGDGTTTSMVLLKSIMEQFWTLPAGYNVHEIIAGMKTAVATAKESILSESIPVNDKVLECVARISSNGDESIVKLVTEAYSHGTDLPFHVQDNRSGRNEVEKIDGCLYEQGYIDPVFINTGRGTCELEKAHILIYDGKITDIYDIKWLLDHVLVTNAQGQLIGRVKGKEEDSIVIICEDIVGRAANFLANAKEAGLGICVIKMYEQTALRQDIMTDLAIMLGAKYSSHYSGQTVKGLTPAVLGFAEKVVVKRTSTIFTQPHHNVKVVENRLKEIKELEASVNTDFEKSELEKRAKRIGGKVVTIHVSKKTSAETEDFKDRLDDALRACAATVELGAAAGGGFTYFRAADKISAELSVFNDGVGIITNVLAAHPCKIYGSTVFGKEMLKAGATVDYKTGKVKDALELGLLDSTKVQVSALENAISVASELMKTKRILTA